MPAGFRIRSNARSVLRDLTRAPKDVSAAIPTALNAATRKARTHVAGTRGVLKRKYGITAKLGKRVFQSKRAKRGSVSAQIWFGGNPLPVERIRGNVRARVGAREITTKTEGLVRRSFVIRVGSGKKLYLRRYGRARTDYGRILTPAGKAFSEARDIAAQETARLYPIELETAIAKRRARARTRTRR